MRQVSGDWLVRRMETAAEVKDPRLLMLLRPPLQWNKHDVTVETRTVEDIEG